MAYDDKSLNKVQLIGNLGQDPELKYTPNNNAVCTLSLATQVAWNDQQNGKQTETEWHRVVLWGKLAENAGQYLNKGSKLYIEGRNKTRKWTDGNGVERYTTEVVATEMQFLGSPQGGNQNQGNQQQNRQQGNQQQNNRNQNNYGNQGNQGNNQGNQNNYGDQNQGNPGFNDDIPF